MLGSAGAETLSIIMVVVYSSECKQLDVSLNRDAYTTRGQIGTFLTETSVIILPHWCLEIKYYTCCGLNQGELELPSWQTRKGHSERRTPVETAPQPPV